ncbi:hypothetical protein [Caballeronia sp. DA-9]
MQIASFSSFGCQAPDCAPGMFVPHFPTSAQPLEKALFLMHINNA